jgi:hypothetical protein
MNNPTTTKCDHPKCSKPAAWQYKVTTLYGVKRTVACQAHTKMVRDYHGMNILSVHPVR